MSPKQFPSNNDNYSKLNGIFKELTNRLTQSTSTSVYQSFQKLAKFFDQQGQVIVELHEIINHFAREKDLLVEENTKLKDELDALSRRFTDAMSVIANRTRNEGGKPSLESVELVERFQQLRGQTFEDTAKRILEYLRSLGIKEVTQANENTKQIKARIQAILTRHILLEDTKTDNAATIDNIRTSLGIPETSVGWLEIREKLQELVDMSHQLVTAIRNTDPPGHLIGDLFNPDQHEVPPGFEASGRITSIIFPAYYLRGPSVKALVITESDQSNRFLESEATEPASTTESSEPLPEATEPTSTTESSEPLPEATEPASTTESSEPLPEATEPASTTENFQTDKPKSQE